MKIGFAQAESPGTVGWVWVQLVDNDEKSRIWFRHEFQDPHSDTACEVRRIVMNQIGKEFGSRVARIRRTAYEQGRRSARNKAHRVETFLRDFNHPDFVGY